MKIFRISPAGLRTPLLFDTFDSLILSRIEFTEIPTAADVIWFDCHSGGGSYDLDTLREVLRCKIPVVAFNRHDSWGDPEHRCNWHGWDDWKELRELPQPWGDFLLETIRHGLLRLYFVRNLQRSRLSDYPAFVRPFELILEPDHDFAPVGFEEYHARPNDFCFIGCSSPWRANLVCGLIRAGFRVDAFFPYFRVPHEHWLDRHRQARFFIEACGHFGSDRPYQLSALAPMLKLHNDQFIRDDWEHLAHCVKVGNYDGTLREPDIELLRELLADPARCHAIYQAGMDHLHARFSATSRASYVLQCMQEAGLT